VEPYSQAIGRFVRGLTLGDIPQGVVDKAKLVLLDTVGVALASSTMDFGGMVTRVAEALGGLPNSRLVGSHSKVAAANAVLANGTLAHGLDYDDTLEEAIVHTGCCAGMTALAVGEEVGANGRSVLEAAIVGTEVMCKIGLVAPGKFHARGFHPTALCSTFGAATAAGKLYGLEQGQWSDAFGLCGSRARVLLNTWQTVPGQNDFIRAGRLMAASSLPCWPVKVSVGRAKFLRARTASSIRSAGPLNTISKSYWS
jgi:2-methylcitrate dehydratase PrpD